MKLMLLCCVALLGFVAGCHRAAPADLTEIDKSEKFRKEYAQAETRARKQDAKQGKSVDDALSRGLDYKPTHPVEVTHD